MGKRILHIVTNVGQYDNGDPTGLWLSGLTTAWDRFEREGCEQDIASPRGGDVPLDPRSLKFPFRSESAKSWLNNPERMVLLKNTPPIRSVDPNTYDAICLAGGHGAMFDFTHNSELHNIIANTYERGAIVASVGARVLRNPQCTPERRKLSGERQNTDRTSSEGKEKQFVF